MICKYELDFYLCIAFLIGFCLYALFFVADRFRSGRLDLLNPGFVFATLYILYNFSLYLNPDIRKMQGACEYAFVGLMGLLGIFAGTTLAHCHLGKNKVSSPIISSEKLLFWSLVLTVASFAMTILMFIKNIGFSNLLSAGSTERNVAAHGILSGFFFLLPIGAGFAIALLFSRKGLFRFSFLAVVFAILTSLFYFGSSRGHLLQTCLLALFVYHYSIERISCRKIILVASSLVIVMIVMGIVRQYINQDTKKIAEAVTFKNVYKSFQLERFEFYFCGVRDIELLEDGPPDGQYFWGSTFVHFIPNLMPQFLNLCQRHESLSKWYMKTYHPQKAKQGKGLGFSPLIDAYFNFGVAGCFFYMFLFAFLLNRLHILALQTPQMSKLRLFDCLVATTIIAFNRTSVSGYFRNYLCIFVFAGLILLTISLLSNSHKQVLGNQFKPEHFSEGDKVELS